MKRPPLPGELLPSLWQSRAVRCLAAAVLFLCTMYVCGVASSFEGPGIARKYIVADDSMITLRIASNFAHGLGLYFNAGERTAANTSLFWPMILSLIFRLVPDLSRCVFLLSVLSSACMALTIALVVFFSETFWIAVCSGATLLVLPPIAEYGSSVWEHVPQTFLITLAFLIYTRRETFLRYKQELCLLLLSLAFLLRPDTLPLMLPVLAAMWWQPREQARLRIAATVFAAAAIFTYYATHHHIYGTFAPNTFHLKVRFGFHAIALGIQYLLRSTVQSAVPVFVLSVTALAVLRRKPRGDQAELVTAAALVLQTAYIVAVGGDNFLYGRFFLLVTPLSVVLVWRMFWDSLTIEHSIGRLVRGCAITCTLAAAASNFAFHLNRLQTEVPIYADGLVTQQPEPLASQALFAEFLRERIRPEDGQIGLFALGALSYYMPDYKFADFLGKADLVIASEPPRWGAIGHNKWDYPYTLAHRNVSVVPAFLMDRAAAEAVVRQRLDFGFAAAFQLDPYLHEHYSFLSAREIGAPGMLGLFVRNDLVPRFRVANTKTIKEPR